MKCTTCKKEIDRLEYRCRICHFVYCDKCSLDHFGLEENNGKVRPKNLFKTFWWLIKKRFNVFQKGDDNV